MDNSNLKLKGFVVDLIKIADKPRDLYELRISRHNKSVSTVCNLMGIRDNVENILEDLKSKYENFIRNFKKNKNKNKKKIHCIHCYNLIVINPEVSNTYCNQCHNVNTHQ